MQIGLGGHIQLATLSSLHQLHRPLTPASHPYLGQAHAHLRHRYYKSQLRVTPLDSTALLERPPQHEHHKRLKVLPRIQYSTNYKELHCEELLQLFSSAGLAFDQCIAPGKLPNNEQAAGKAEELLRLEHALEKSMTVVIASVMEDKLLSYTEPQQEVSEASKDDWTWVTARRQRKKRKILVGFARATGDGALTATIHDVVVLPELQGLGLGRKLLAKATTQVRNKTGTTDIGLAAFPASYGFFSKCGFDLDREQSTFMTFALSKCNADALHNFQSKPSLLALLAGGAK